MTLDLVIRGGWVVDGTGAPPQRADVGVANGRIATVGRFDEQARRVLDVDGLTVTPGFIDNHTHYDAQILWDADLLPSPLHGVTTVIAGNCGYTLAPAPPSQREFLLGLLSRVEAVPLVALTEGVRFGWESFEEYLGFVDRPLAVNALFMVGHSALRRAVLGSAGSTEPADNDAIAAMCALLDGALAAGGLGLSTARQVTHVDGHGRPTPAQVAQADELVALASVCRRYSGTRLQITPGSILRGLDQQDRDLMVAMAVASRRPLFWVAVQFSGSDAELSRRMLSVADEARSAGATVRGVVGISEGLLLRQDFQNPFLMRAYPDPWPEVLDLPPNARRAALADSVVRQRLRAALSTPGHARGAGFDHRWEDFEISDVADEDARDLVGRRVGDIADERGIDPFEAALDLAVDTDLTIGFVQAERPGIGDWAANVRAAKVEAMRDERALWGAADSGAHVDAMVGGSFATRALARLVRVEGSFSLEEVVHQLTGAQARAWGLRDRGTIKAGAHADLAVFDARSVGPMRMRPSTDWPGGAWHLTQDAVGVEHVIVAGTEVVHGGSLTGRRPGRVLRSGTDTA